MTDEGYQILIKTLESVDDNLKSMKNLAMLLMILLGVMSVLIMIKIVYPCVKSLKEKCLPWFRHDKQSGEQKDEAVDEAVDRDCRV
jgi:hypothetical protein